MPTLRRALLLTGLATLPLAACYKDPAAELQAMQASIDLQDTLNELGMRTTEMQFTLDSLRSVVARQDSTIYRLANLAGVPYPR
jgi:hypothetical protein